MRCPYCGEVELRVIDSRPVGDGEVTKQNEKVNLLWARRLAYQ